MFLGCDRCPPQPPDIRDFLPRGPHTLKPTTTGGVKVPLPPLPLPLPRFFVKPSFSSVFLRPSFHAEGPYPWTIDLNTTPQGWAQWTKHCGREPQKVEDGNTSRKYVTKKTHGGICPWRYRLTTVNVWVSLPRVACKGSMASFLPDLVVLVSSSSLLHMNLQSFECIYDDIHFLWIFTLGLFIYFG